MKNILLLFILTTFCSYLRGQVSFENVDYTVTLFNNKTGSVISCKGPGFDYRFSIPQRSEKTDQQKIILIDSQVVMITPLRVSHPKTGTGEASGIKELLSIYHRYELDYFKNELHIEIIDPASQWASVGSRIWLVWYFKVGTIPLATASKTDVQLFASTIIDGNILTVNAPIFENNDFNKAALIVNSLMESLK